MKNISSKHTKKVPDNRMFNEQFVITTNLPHFKSYSIVIGFLLLLIGLVGMILPQFMALEITLLIATLLILGGIAWVAYAFKYSAHTWAEWLKPFLLLITGGLMLFYPINGIAVIGLMLAVYLTLDAFGSFILARMIYPIKGWGWMAFNGVASSLLVMLTIVDWPASSTLLVGLYVAISLFFDGWALIYLGLMQRKVIPQK